MALLGNYNQFNKNPIYYSGGDNVSGIAGLRSNFSQPGLVRSRFYGEGWIDAISEVYGLPAGYTAPYSWALPPKVGGLVSNVGIAGIGAMSGNGALGINLTATMDGTGDISSALGSLIMTAVASLSGSSTMTGDTSGLLTATAALVGSGDMTGALGALASAVASMSGSSTVTGNVNAIANLTANIYVNTGTATARENADAVWNAVVTDYNTLNSTGKVLKQIKSISEANL